MPILKTKYCRFFPVISIIFLAQATTVLSLRFEDRSSPFEETFKDISTSAQKISEKIRLSLNEADIHVDKYIDQLEETVDVSKTQFQDVFVKVDSSVEKFYETMGEIIPKKIDCIEEELKSKDSKAAEIFKKSKTVLVELKRNLLALYEEVKKPIVENYNEVTEQAVTVFKPIVKKLKPIVKDVEEIILTLIPDKKKEIKKN